MLCYRPTKFALGETLTELIINLKFLKANQPTKQVCKLSSDEG